MRSMNASYCALYDMGKTRAKEPAHFAANVRFAKLGADCATEGKSVASAVAEFVNENHFAVVLAARHTSWNDILSLAIHQFLRERQPWTSHRNAGTG